MSTTMNLAETVTDRPLPQSPEAERAVLGSVLISPKTYYRLADLPAGDFSGEAHRILWSGIQRLAAAGIEPDLLCLKDHLRERDEIAKVGGSAYVSGLIDGIPDVANVEKYARIVKKRAAGRRLIKIGGDLMRRGFEEQDEPEEVAADAIAKLTPQATIEEAQARPLYEVIGTAFDRAEARMQRGESPAFRSGFSELDRFDIFRPTFVVIAAASNHGKSSWLRAASAGFARNGHPVLHLTLESTPEEIAWRHVAAESGVPHSRVSDWRYLESREFDALRDVHRAARNLPIWMTRGVQTIEGIYAEARRLQAIAGVQVILIDYFQLIQSPGGARDREERMAAAAQRLLGMSKDLGMLIIAASQLNEDRKERGGGRIHQGDLKYAKALGEAARVVLAFQRPHADDKANPDLRPCEVRFQVEKHNEGRTGDYEAHFDEITQQFSDGGCEENDCRLLRKSSQGSLGLA